MKTVAFTRARAELKKMVDAAARGEVVRITRNGKVVAELRPPQPDVDDYWSQRKPVLRRGSKLLDHFLKNRKAERW